MTPATCTEEIIPARYETRCKQVCVQPETCREEIIPARYETRCKQVCVTPATCTEEIIPARYETRCKQVCVTPATCTQEVIPARYEDVCERVCVQPGYWQENPVPAKYETRTKKVCVEPGRWEWRRNETCEVPGGAVGTAMPLPAPVATEAMPAVEAGVGVRDMLLALRARQLPLGVASNFDHRLKGILQALDIEKFFDVVMTPARCGAAKPDARLFEAACTALQLSPAETLYVGEAGENDLDAALRAGLQGRDAAAGGGLVDLPAWFDTLAKLG